MGPAQTPRHHLVEHLSPTLALPSTGRPYPLEAAVAETVATCAGAGAREIHIGIEFAGPTSWIRIVADADGIPAAARMPPPGAQAPHFDRAPGLGGVGMVHAGLAHCHGLTLAGHPGTQGGAVQVHRWKSPLSAPLSSLVHSDLDLVVEPLTAGAVTVVLWEGLVEVQRYQRREGRAVEHGLDRIRERLTAHLGLVLHRLIEHGVTITVNGGRVSPTPPVRGAFVARYPALLLHEGCAVELTADLHCGTTGGVDGFIVYAGDVAVQVGGWNRLAAPPSRGSASVSVDVPGAAQPAFSRNLLTGRVLIPDALVPTLKALAVMAQDLANRSDAA